MKLGPATTIVPLAELLERRGGEPRPRAWLAATAPVRPRPLFGLVEEALVVVAPPSAEPALPAEAEAIPDPTEALEAMCAAAQRKGTEAARDQIEALMARYFDCIRNLGAAAREAARPDAGEVVGLALVIARELIGRELSGDQSVLIASLDEAMRSLRSDGSARVRLSPSDAAWARLHRTDLRDAAVSLIEDPALAPGGCVIETPRRVIDASIEARLAAVQQVLLDVVRGDPERAEDEDYLAVG
jgi:flagellar biosynthesis/type III secretory pathway protein FliH